MAQWWRAQVSHLCDPGSNPGVDAVRESLNRVSRQSSQKGIFLPSTVKNAEQY